MGQIYRLGATNVCLLCLLFLHSWGWGYARAPEVVAGDEGPRDKDPGINILGLMAGLRGVAGLRGGGGLQEGGGLQGWAGLWGGGGL